MFREQEASIGGKCVMSCLAIRTSDHQWPISRVLETKMSEPSEPTDASARLQGDGDIVGASNTRRRSTIAAQLQFSDGAVC
jgi:hypothetical protein